jgi:hypothetical protein
MATSSSSVLVTFNPFSPQEVAIALAAMTAAGTYPPASETHPLLSEQSEPATVLMLAYDRDLQGRPGRFTHLVRDDGRLVCGIKARRNNGHWTEVRLPLEELDCRRCSARGKSAPTPALVVQEHDDRFFASILEDYYGRADLTLADILEQHGLDGDNYKHMRSAIYGNLWCHGDPDRPLRRPNRTVNKDCGGQGCHKCGRCLALQAISLHREDHGCAGGEFYVPGVGTVKG